MIFMCIIGGHYKKKVKLNVFPIVRSIPQGDQRTQH